MASSQSGTFSTATPHTNPFASQDDESRKFTSDVPLGVGSNDPTLLGRPLVPVPAAIPTQQGGSSFDTTTSSSSRANFPAAPLDTGANTSSASSYNNSGLSSSSSTTTTGRSATGAASDAANSARASAQDSAQTVLQRAQQAAQNVKQNIQNAETKENLAGDLAPSESPLSPSETPAGTEHVTNIISGLGGAIASAPAAALESISPVAASKVSDAAAAISARLPAMSLADVQAKATNLANAAYNQIPEGTAQTIQGYTGAAVQKAQEVLPPALGGSTTTGNTGSGDLAKNPSQLASEYGSAAADNTKATAGSIGETISAYASAAQQKAAELAGIAQKKAGETAEVAQQNASQAASAAQNKASELSQSASQTASSAASATQQKASEVSQSASQTASSYGSAAQNQAQNTGASSTGSYSATSGSTGGYSTTTSQDTAPPGQYAYSRATHTEIPATFPGSNSNQIDRTQ